MKSERKQCGPDQSFPAVRFCQLAAAMVGVVITVVVYKVGHDYGGVSLGLLWMALTVPADLVCRFLGLDLASVGVHHRALATSLIVAMAAITNACLLFLVGTALGWFIKAWRAAGRVAPLVRRDSEDEG